MWTRGVVGIVVFLVGAVWIGQGLNVLHGSGMSGHGVWAAIGAVFVLVGLALLRSAARSARQNE
jgi:hypothetical protein